ncbi:hypothetical protein ACFXTH_041320 [Malus domestica]
MTKTTQFPPLGLGVKESKESKSQIPLQIQGAEKQLNSFSCELSWVNGLDKSQFSISSKTTRHFPCLCVHM